MRENDWKPTEMPAILIGKASRALSRIDDEKLRTVGLSVAQLPVLAALKNGEKLPQKELARLAGVEQPSMAQLLARMARDGLIKREPDPHDGRSTLISLSAKALKRLEPGRSMLRASNEEALRGFTSEESRLFVSLLERLIQNVGA